VENLALPDLDHRTVERLKGPYTIPAHSIADLVLIVFGFFNCVFELHICWRFGDIYIQSVPGGKCQTSGGCFLC